MADTKLNQLVVYVLHCLMYPAFIMLIYHIIAPSSLYVGNNEVEISVGFMTSLFVLRLLPVVGVPRLVMTVAGLFHCVKCYTKHVPLHGPPLLSPFICFRVVTRGDYPDLVKQNVMQNIRTCLNVGLNNFVLEVVTDVAIQLQENIRIRQIVVPGNYVTRTGVLYKGKALQYCLEDGIDQLNDQDWIVHLDEESLLTEDSARGIINFVMDGQHQFGQGLISYNSDPVNEFLTLMDAVRVADDVGALRGSFKLFHKPLFGWKGSYMVCKAVAEKHVTFEYGLAGSLAEDCIFCLNAFKLGYTFNFVEGEILEKSPFTLIDFIKQRKRWFEGKWLILWSQWIPFWYKLSVVPDLLSWAITPVPILTTILQINYSTPHWMWSDALNTFLIGTVLYSFVYGVVKSHTLLARKRLSKLTVQLAGGVIAIIPFYTVCYLAVLIWYAVGKKMSFHVVKKWNKTTTPKVFNISQAISKVV